MFTDWGGLDEEQNRLSFRLSIVAWCEMPISVVGFQLVPLFPATAGRLQYKPISFRTSSYGRSPAHEPLSKQPAGIDGSVSFAFISCP